ncbi:hypothetical protein [Kozakia baliensis]|uniref:hypothetical protein n=1 Tax=Kozakia baliensis TaxID=153496 RepID=UPI00089DBC54|nr:hypothetical protein [Kozakia baliensis]
MLASQIIEIDGVFVGSLIQDTERRAWRVHAIHDAVRPFHNHVLDNPDDLPRHLEHARDEAIV